MLRWRSSEADRLAEVDHVDGRRRPWRSAGVALASFALGAAMAPRPLGAMSVGVVGAGALFCAVAAWRLPIIRGRREIPGSVELRVAVEPDGLVVERAGLRRRLAPRAIEGLTIGSDHLFLHLAEGEILTVPCRAFSARGGLDRFVEQVERFRRRGSPPDDPPEAGRDRWRLDYGPLPSRSARDRGEQRERLILAGFAALSPLVLLVSTEPWRGGLDLVLWALFGAIGAVFAAASHRARGAVGPVGPVELGLGPEGGWIRTELGTARFGWDRVRAVDRDPLGVVLRLADQVIPIPLSALPADRERLLGDLEAWLQIARPPPIARPAAGDPDPDPFAPPR